MFKHHRILSETKHRPYPLPRRPWAMSMEWHDLLFMHWTVDPKKMRELVPSRLELDLFDGQAWLGIVPFRMSGVRPRLVPPLPGWPGKPNPSRFLELNVRTYVQVDGKPGVYFFSLDAESRLAVRMARRCFHLPYFDARMTSEDDVGWFHYRSQRTHKEASPASFDVRYRPANEDVIQAEPGSLEHFLTERYCLYAMRGDTPLRGEIHHIRWPLQSADVDINDMDMTRELGISLNGPPICSHFAKRLDVVAWLNQRT